MNTEDHSENLELKRIQSLESPESQSNDTAPPVESTQPVIPRRPRRRRRSNGKVARLPRDIRNMVNQSLCNGARYVEIIASLTAQGYPGFKPPHLSSWAYGGYRAWLADQEAFERGRLRSEATAALLGSLRADGRCELTDLNELRLASQLDRLLEAVDETSLKSMLAEKPEEYFRLTKAVTAHVAARAQRQQAELLRLKYELEMRKIAEKERRRLEPKGVTKEEMARIHAKLNLM